MDQINENEVDPVNEKVFQYAYRPNKIGQIKAQTVNIIDERQQYLQAENLEQIAESDKKSVLIEELAKHLDSAVHSVQDLSGR